MADDSDMNLVAEYADGNSELAFARLVERHINLVYSVALRYAGNPQDAQDGTQAVFIILAKKSKGLRQRTTLTGWLYETTRFTARQLLRTRARQQAREQEAYPLVFADGHSEIFKLISYDQDLAKLRSAATVPQ